MSKLQVSSPARRPRRVMARRLLGDGHGCRIRSRLACHAVRASGRWRFATGEGCRRQRREITPPGRSRADLDYFRARKSEVGRGLPGAHQIISRIPPTTRTNANLTHRNTTQDVHFTHRTNQTR